MNTDSTTSMLPSKAAISRGARWALRSYPFSWLDTTDPSTPRVWQFVNVIDDPTLLILRCSGGDTCRPRYYWDYTAPRSQVEAARKNAISRGKPFPQTFGNN